MSRGGSIAPTPRGGSIAPAPRKDFGPPSSYGGSIPPSSRSGSSVPVSRNASVSVSDLREGPLTATTQKSPNRLHERRSFTDSRYNSDEEESQLPAEHYYGRASIAPVDDDVPFESTQRARPDGGTVGLTRASPLPHCHSDI